MEVAPRRFEFRDYVRIVLKRLWLTLLVFVGVILAGGLYSLTSPKRYQASSLLRVRTTPQMLFMAAGENPAIPERISLDTQARLATTSIVAGRAADALKDLPEEDRVLATPEEIHSSVRAMVEEPDLIRLIVTEEDERRAVAFANACAEAFVLVDQEARRLEVRAGVNFLDTRLLAAEAKLAETEADLSRFLEKTGLLFHLVPGPEGTRPQIGSAGGVARYRSERRAAEVMLREARARAQQMGAQAAAEPELRASQMVERNPVLVQLRGELAQRQLAVAQLRSRYTDEHPAVQEGMERVEALKADIDQIGEHVLIESTTEPNPAAPALRQQAAEAENQVAELEARLSALDGVVAEMLVENEDLPEQHRMLNRLYDQLALTQETYRALLTSLRDAELNVEMREGTVRVVDKATVAGKVGPELFRTLVFSAIIGTFLGVGLAFVLEIMDNTVRTADDLTRDVGIPFLGLIPFVEGAKDELVTLTAPKSPPAEAYRTLRSNINFATVDTPVTTVVVTSAGAAEGKTWTVANLAVVMAQSGQSVLLMDTDLRRPKIHRYFDVDSSRGLTNALVGDFDFRDLLHETGIPGLKILASGPLPPNPAELLDSEKMSQLVNDVADHFDVVLMDSPPAIVLTDASVLAAKVDTVICVCESGKVTREACREMKRLLENARGAILGGVVNKMRLSGTDYYYYYYYYYDYGRTGRRRRR